MGTPGSPGQSWEMRLASARHLRCLALCSPLLPSVIRLPQSSQGSLKKSSDHVTHSRLQPSNGFQQP